MVVRVQVWGPDGTVASSGPIQLLVPVQPDVPTGPASARASATVGNCHFDLELGPPQGRPARRPGKLTVTPLAGRGTRLRAGVGLECRLRPDGAPHWLIPGLFYGENRRPDNQRVFPRFATDPSPGAVMESSSWSFRADRAATPVVIGHGAGGGVGLSTPEVSPVGQSGLGLAWEDGPVLRLHWPYREEPVTYFGSADPLAAEVTTAEMVVGEPVELDFALYLLGPDRHAYADLLRHLWESPSAPGAGALGTGGGSQGRVAWSSLEKTAQLTAHGLHQWHFRPQPPVLLETAAFDREALGERGDRQAMHVSWVSGVPYAYALLRHGRRRGQPAYVGAASAVIDHIAANLTPGGTFWGQWQAENGWGIGWTPEKGRLHSRTLADATLFMLRAALFEQGCGAQACEPHGGGAEYEQWLGAARSNLDVVVGAQRTDGALPAALHVEDGRPLDWRGSAGLAWVAPLASAGVAWSEPAYGEAASAAGAYFEQFVEAEYLCGAPEDVDLAPTSEDGYLAVMSYMALWRAEGDRRWLAAAQRAADWMLSFRYTYDVSFPTETFLGHYRFCTRGGDQASPSNQHLHAFGLICQPEMAELSEALGDRYYRDRAREALAWARQFVARADGDFNAYRGMVSERFYQTNCFQAKGMLLTLSHAWSVGVVLLACEEAIASGQEWEWP